MKSLFVNIQYVLLQLCIIYMKSEALSKPHFIIITFFLSPTQLSSRNKLQMTLILFLSDSSSFFSLVVAEVHFVSHTLSSTFCPFFFFSPLKCQPLIHRQVSVFHIPCSTNASSPFLVFQYSWSLIPKKGFPQGVTAVAREYVGTLRSSSTWINLCIIINKLPTAIN